MSDELSAMIHDAAREEAAAFRRESPYGSSTLAHFTAGIRRKRIARGATMTVSGLAAVGVIALGIGQPWHTSPVAETMTQNPMPRSSPAVTAGPSLVVSAARLGPSGHATLTTLDGAVWITADAGATRRALDLPGALAGGHSVDVRGTTIVAATIDSGQLVYQRSEDAGRTWISQRLRAQLDSTEVNIALSADGSAVALSNPRAHSPQFGGSMVVCIGPTGHDLITRDVPLDGTLVWVGTHVLVAGGPLSSELFASDDQGKTWAQSTVAGVKAPKSGGLASGTPNIGPPVSSAGGAIVPVTLHSGTGASLSLLATTDGQTFTSIGSVALTGDVGAGVTAIGSTAGPVTFVFADPTSTNLFWVSGSLVTTVPTTGLPGPPESITFSDTTNGLASVSSSSSGALLFRTSDGGRTWEAIARPSV